MMAAVQTPRTLTCALVYADETYVRRNNITQKLARLGLRVEKLVEARKATAASFARVAVVVVLVDFVMKGDLDRVLAQATVRTFRVSHKFSDKGWRDLEDYVREAGKADPLVVASEAVAEEVARPAPPILLAGGRDVAGSLEDVSTWRALAQHMEAELVETRDRSKAEIASMRAVLAQSESKAATEAKAAAALRTELADARALVSKLLTEREETNAQLEFGLHAAASQSARISELDAAYARQVAAVNEGRARVKEAEAKADAAEKKVTELKKLASDKEKQIAEERRAKAAAIDALERKSFEKTQGAPPAPPAPALDREAIVALCTLGTRGVLDPGDALRKIAEVMR